MALLAGSGEAMEAPRCYAQHQIALAQSEIQIAVRIEVNCPRPINWRSLNRSAFRRWLTLARPRKCIDEVLLQIHAPNPVVANVADKQASVRMKCDAVRLLKFGFRRRSTIAAEPRGPRPCYRSDLPGPPVPHAHTVRRHTRKHQMPVYVKLYLSRSLPSFPHPH